MFFHHLLFIMLVQSDSHYSLNYISNFLSHFSSISISNHQQKKAFFPGFYAEMHIKPYFYRNLLISLKYYNQDLKINKEKHYYKPKKNLILSQKDKK
ncbi:hypothetical protein BpHYR1_029635 [Brachionus plicatilis]|uniref:Uncharacterized protein n=1 Tax=Brachionus plicatilis TaxID=10195 RepID=A0A3M7RCD3_BRAPC|nr:hypothetical protein BpHYR1_029635 [Brachionus plicatilis]